MQKREPPAYQEYASAVLSKIQFREMSLSERGLLYTLKLECWVNHSVPSNIKKLSRIIGISDEELRPLVQSLSYFFDEQDGRLSSPELDNYRNHLSAVSEGKKRGAIETNRIKEEKKAIANAEKMRTQDSRKCVKNANAENTLASSVKSSSIQPSGVSDITTTYIPIGDYTINPDEEVGL